MWRPEGSGRGILIAALLAIAVAGMLLMSARAVGGIFPAWRAGLTIVAGFGGTFILFFEAYKRWRLMRRALRWHRLAGFAIVSTAAIAALVVALTDPTLIGVRATIA